MIGESKYVPGLIRILRETCGRWPYAGAKSPAF